SSWELASSRRVSVLTYVDVARRPRRSTLHRKRLSCLAFAPTSKRLGALGDQPGVAILGYMLLAQGEHFGVVTEGELVFASPALIDLIGEAVKLALVGIKVPFADERIVLREY